MQSLRNRESATQTGDALLLPQYNRFGMGVQGVGCGFLQTHWKLVDEPRPKCYRCLMTTLEELRQLLDSNPDVNCALEASSLAAAEVEASVAYLESDVALRSLQRDAYWPKWDSPWWHMLTLYEMGLAHRIPKVAVEATVGSMARLPVKFFPIDPKEVSPEWDLVWDSTCHCAAGSIYAILSGCGANVDEELPWLRTWFPKYQMLDGGMSCDPEAYRVEGECPSSMVGLMPAFEAMLFHADNLSDLEYDFLDRGAGFLLGRELRLGSDSVHNCEEKEQALAWLQPCFPRFYFYDVLRGLYAFLHWCHRRNRRVPLDRVGEVVAHLVRISPEGTIRCQRRAVDGQPSRIPLANGEWTRADLASSFPLLNALGIPGEVSPHLTQQWTESKRLLRKLTVDTAPSKVVWEPPNTDWEARAAAEAERFGALFGENLVRVHHVGSTSIPGIWAKPTIDLIPEFRAIEKLDAMADSIKSAGYEYWGEYGLPGRRFCPRIDPVVGRVANLHCYQSGAQELRRHLAFRDYLRTFPEIAKEYETEKLRARDLHPWDMVAYNGAKNPWIRRVEKEALAWAASLEAME